MAWVTKQQCKDFADEIPEVTGASDTYLDGLISRAERMIKRLTEQDFSSELATAKDVDGSGNTTLGLDIRLYSIDSIVVDTSIMTDYVYLKYGDNYSLLKFDPDPVYAYRSHRNYSSAFSYIFSFGVENITITGDWGWSAVPDDIKTLDKMLVRNLSINDANARGASGPFLTEKIGDYSYSRSSLKDLKIMGMIDAEMKDIINEYNWFNVEDSFLY